MKHKRELDMMEVYREKNVFGTLTYRFECNIQKKLFSDRFITLGLS